MRSVLSAILCSITALILTGQSITGTIKDAKNQTPIDLATVYFDGTTRGTTTNEKGEFELSVKGIALPAKLVVSHLNYKTYSKLITTIGGPLSLRLEPRQIEIETVEVAGGKSQREKNLKEFRKLFFGEDAKARAIKILNEEDLVFSRDYGPKNKRALNFKVSTRAPLQIDLPDMGYKVEMDLVNSKLDYKTNKFDYLGHFYFQPYEGEDGKPAAIHRKNRMLAYYNSHQHFCRSLYENKLAENGYQLFEEYQETSRSQIEVMAFNIQPYLRYIDGDKVIIQSLMGRRLVIMFNADGQGYPIDLRYRESDYSVRSDVEFTSHNSVIRSDGTMVDSSLFFSGTIGQKAVSALLPSDYKLPGK